MSDEETGGAAAIRWARDAERIAAQRQTVTVEQVDTPRALTLTDFLLARLAEDEADATGADAYRSWHTIDCGTQMGYFMEECSCGHPARMLAEVAAKRGVVEYAAQINVIDDAVASPESRAVRGALKVVLLGLAQPYSDHPDFREEWRGGHLPIVPAHLKDRLRAKLEAPSASEALLDMIRSDRPAPEGPIRYEEEPG